MADVIREPCLKRIADKKASLVVSGKKMLHRSRKNLLERCKKLGVKPIPKHLQDE